jgi:hypothetical protein
MRHGPHHTSVVTTRTVVELLISCNINTKRLRPNDLNPTFIWHCRLDHINEKHIEKLHKDGLLSSFDFESFDTCESCLLGKMTKVRGQVTCWDLYIPMYVDR